MPARMPTTTQTTEDAHGGQQAAQQVLNFVWLALSQGWERHRGAWEHAQHLGTPAVVSGPAPVDESVGALSESSSHVSLKELMEEQDEREDDSSLPPDLLPFLRAVGVVELNHLRAMSMMSTLCYGMEKKVNEVSMRRLGLDLVTTSIAWEKCLDAGTARAKAVEEGFAFGDGMSMYHSRATSST